MFGRGDTLKHTRVNIETKVKALISDNLRRDYTLP
jgi:hypothetical protein